MRRGSSCVLKNPARTEQGVVFRFDCEPFKGGDERAVVKLREAVDLVYRAFALYPGIAQYFQQGTDRDGWQDMSGLSDPTIKRQLLSDGPFEIKIFAGVRQFKEVTSLKRKMGDEFLVGLSNALSTGAAFLEARAHLDALLEAKNPLWSDAIVLNPIQVECFIDPADRLLMTRSEGEMFFDQVTAFADVLDKFEPRTFRRSNHIPLSVEIASIRVPPTPISPNIAATVSAMVDMKRSSLNYTRVILDPRLVMCSREELSVFLRAIRATEVELNPAESDIVEIAPMITTDNIRSVLRRILTAISDCGTVSTIQIGGLLVLCTDPRSRTEIFEVLIDTVMVRAQPLTLVFDLGETGELDGQSFTSIARQWKTENAEKKLRVKQLILGLDDSNGWFTNAILTNMDEVEEISSTNHDPDAPPISTQDVIKLLHRFRTIRALSLGHVELDSMHVFSDHAPSTLQSLSLTGLRLGDRQSFAEFVRDLGRSELPLSRQLRHLSIKEFRRTDAVRFRLNRLDVEYLACALRFNRVLESVHAFVEEDKIADVMEQVLMVYSAAGSVIPAPPDVRLSREEKARRIAFLSVVHEAQGGSLPHRLPVLDTFLVGHIFAFSDPCVPRIILIG